MFPQRHQILSVFRPSDPTIRGLHVSLIYPYTNIEIMVCQKNIWMWHSSGTDWQDRIKNFSKVGERIKERGEWGGVNDLCKL